MLSNPTTPIYERGAPGRLFFVNLTIYICISCIKYIYLQLIRADDAIDNLFDTGGWSDDTLKHFSQSHYRTPYKFTDRIE